MRITRAGIHLRRLKHNYDGIKRRIGANVKVMGIVKANAYGHGAVEIARALAQFGCEYLGVAFLEEGIPLRDAGIQTPILVLSALMAEHAEGVLDHSMDATISSIDAAEALDRTARKRGIKAQIHVKVDTGMERIGVHASDGLQFVRQVSQMNSLEIIGLYSHFATSDERDKSFAIEQLARFKKLVKELTAAGIHIPLIHFANSGAVLDLPESYYSMVRPGIMLYGYYPSKETSESVPLQPVMELHSQVVLLKTIGKGTSVSYGRRYFAPTTTTIATVPIGYADGYSRRLTNKTEVLINGRRYPVAGTICMDHLMVDVGVNSGVAVGDDVVLLGESGKEQICGWDLAEAMNTIPYELLTGISGRVPREYFR